MKSNDISSFRNEHGEGYYTVISDQITIHWKPLSIEEFFIYENLIKSNTVSFAVFEDEIFRKCVLDKELLKDIEFLPAGIISIVAQNIVSYSGPSSIDDFNEFLNLNRQIAASPLHELTPYIVRAFPSYKLEDIYAMPYEVFMLRLAQAESLLIKLGILKEPFSLITPEKEPPKKKPNLTPEQIKSIWEDQRKPNKVHKDLDKERELAEQASGSMLAEDPVERARMVQEATSIYKDKLNNMDFYKKK